MIQPASSPPRTSSAVALPGDLRASSCWSGPPPLGCLILRQRRYSHPMPGVEVHAQVLENVLTQSTLSRPSYALGAELVVVVLVGLAIIALVPILGAMTVFLTGAGHCRATGRRRMVSVLDTRLSVRRVLPADLFLGRADGHGVHQLLPRRGAATPDQERLWPIPFAGPSGGIGRSIPIAWCSVVRRAR